MPRADLYGADLTDCCYISAGVGGNFRRNIMCNPEKDIVKAGCFKGTLAEFKARVVKDYGKDYGSYKAVIAYLDAVISEK